MPGRDGVLRTARYVLVAALLLAAIPIVLLDPATDVVAIYPAFGANVLVDDSAALVQSPDIAADTAGTVHVVWADRRAGGTDDDIYYSRSIDSGQSWSAAVRIDTAPAGSQAFTPSIATSTDTPPDVYVVWKEQVVTVHQIWSRVSHDGGVTWAGPVRVDSGAPVTNTVAAPQVAVDPAGKVYAAWEDRRNPTDIFQIYGAASANQGVSWGANVEISAADFDVNSELALQPSLIASGTDAFVVAYAQQDPVSYSIRAATTGNGGGTWSRTLVTSVGASGYASRPSVTAGGGTIYTVWEETRAAPAAYEIRYSGSTDGGTLWTPSVRVDDASATLNAAPANPDITFIGTRAYTVWSDQRTLDRGIYASGTDDGGATWGDLVAGNDPRVDDETTSTAQNAPAAAGFAASLYAVWQDDRNSASTHDIYFARYVMPPDLLITEFRDAPDGTQEVVEIYNYGPTPVTLVGLDIVLDGTPYALDALGSIPSLSYRTVGNWAGADLFLANFPVGLAYGNQGGTIALRDGTGTIFSEVRYGQAGVVPDPLNAGGATTSRYFNGVQYEDQWAMTSAPTLGSANGGGYVRTPPELILNEVLGSVITQPFRFIELYYTGNTSLNTTGYRLAGGSTYTIPPNRGVTLTPANPVTMVATTDGPVSVFMGQLLGSGDNLYLYDPSWNLLDEVGWSTAHASDTSLCRTPAGNGTYDGYDDPTSIAASWTFGCVPTPPLLAIGPTPQSAIGEFGQVVRFNLTVTNKQFTTDYLDLATQAGPNGWTVQLYDALDVAPLTDSPLDGDGIPDTGPLGTEQGLDITVRVTIPYTTPVAESESINITATTSLGAQAVARLSIALAPFLQVDRRANPTTINILGTGTNEQTAITIDLRGRGIPVGGQTVDEADVVFVIDDTGSMGTWIDQVKADVGYITDRLLENTSSLYLGLVSYKDVPPWGPYEVDVDTDLTNDVNAFKAAVNNLFASGGGDFEENPDIGLEVAANLSWRPSANPGRIMVLIGDAPAHPPVGNEHLVQVATWARQSPAKQIHTSAIACGNDPTMTYWFNATSVAGEGYFQQLGNPANMTDAILTGILQYFPGMDRAASDPDIYDPNPMIRDVLPPYIGVVPNSFVDPVGLTPKPPAFQGLDGSGNIVLEWNVSSIRVNQTWGVRYLVTSTLPGLVPTNVLGPSRVAFINWNNVSTSASLPEAPVTVLAPPLLPPRLATTWDGANSVGLSWIAPPVLPNHYLIFRVTGDPRAFSTLDAADAYATVSPPATSWTDPQPLGGPEERYYLVRSATLGDLDLSMTSNTAGVFVGTLNPGLTAISRPLEYFPWVDYTAAGPNGLDTVAEYRVAFGASDIELLDAAGTWVPGGTQRLAVGEAYLVSRATPGRFVFTGLPGGMIRFEDYTFAGFDPATDARSLLAAAIGDDVVLTFAQPPAIVPLVDHYEVWRSTTRTGFFDGSAVLVGGGVVPAPAGFTVTVTDAAAVVANGEVYYMVVPLSASLGRGASSYSIGVWTRTFTGTETFGLPLRPDTLRPVSWYADAVPGALGIVWLTAAGVWIPHFTEMPTGTYDVTAMLGAGFQIGVRSSVRFSFFGW